ncbi:MAG: 4Fe-4S binding protein [Candidatus Neomarinimicrobiota bacterium]
MVKYFTNIFETIGTMLTGLGITWRHLVRIKKDNVTLQYPEERWPRPERNIGFDFSDYNVIRTKLNVDIDDCIGCLKCERACPVDCIKIETVKAESRGEDMPLINHQGLTSNGTRKALVITRFSIDMSECCFCNLCTYPCPEDCIYMVGGPNSEKHIIDYEYSEYDRRNLIYQFAKTISAEQKENLQTSLNKPKVPA